MSTNLNPPQAHVHDLNLNCAKGSPRSRLSPNMRRVFMPTTVSPTDLSMNSTPVISHPRSTEYGESAFLNPNKSVSPSPLQIGRCQSSSIPLKPQVMDLKFNPGHFLPSNISKPMLTMSSDMKFHVNNMFSNRESVSCDIKPVCSSLNISNHSSPSPLSISVTATSSGNIINHSVLRNYQASPDAMLSATVNATEKDLLREGGFDISVTSPRVSLCEDNLLSAGPSSIASSSSLRPPSHTMYELFDEDAPRDSYSNASQDLRLSPHNLSNSSSGASAVTDSFVSRSNVMPNHGIIASKPGPSHSPIDMLTAKNIVPNVNSKIVKLKPKCFSGKPGTIPCPTCGKMFSSSSALTKHKLTHSDERKYVCQLCAKAFKRQDHLNGHMLTHRTKKPYECKVEGCGKSYCDARSLRRHNENHHSNQLNSELLNSEILLNRIQLATRAAQNLPGQVDSAASQLQMLAVQGEHGLSASLQSALRNWQTSNNSEHNSDGPSPSTSLLLQRLQQEPKIWAQVSRSALGLDCGLVPKPVSCSICNKSFKNMPALNGHMRLHGGYFKKETDSVKKEVNKKQAESSSSHGTPPLQTASSNIRAMIEEKIKNQRRVSSLDVKRTSSGVGEQTCAVAGSFPSNFVLTNVKTQLGTSHGYHEPPPSSQLSLGAQQPSSNNAMHDDRSKSRHSFDNMVAETFAPATSMHSNQHHRTLIGNEPIDQQSVRSLIATSQSSNRVQDSGSFNVQSSNNYDAYDMQSDNVNNNCSDENMDYDSIEPSVNLKTETDDVFISEAELKQTLEELKKEFMMPQNQVEKFRRHSDSDHFIVPKMCPSKNNPALTDQLRRKVLTQRRTYRLASDPGGDPFCDIPEQFTTEESLASIEGNQQNDASYFPAHQDPQQYSNPTTPTQNSIGFFQGPQSDMQTSVPTTNLEHDSLSHQTHMADHNIVQQPHPLNFIQDQQMSAPSTPTQNHGSFFQVSHQTHDQVAAPSTPTQPSVGFFQTSHHHEPISNPCTPVQTSVGFFQAHQQHHGHASMPSTPTQPNASFFSSQQQQQQQHSEHFPNASSDQGQYFAPNDNRHHNASVPSTPTQPNVRFFHKPQIQGQFSVPSTPTQPHASFFQNNVHQMSAPSTPTELQPPVSVLSYSSHGMISNQPPTAYSSLPLQIDLLHKSFQFPQNESLQQSRSGVETLTDHIHHSSNVFSETFSGTLDDEDDAFMSGDIHPANQMIPVSCNSENQTLVSQAGGRELPAITISDSVFGDMNGCVGGPNVDVMDATKEDDAVDNPEVSCSKQSNPTSNLLLTIPKSTAQVNDNDDVFISPSSLPTSPIRIKRKHRPEPLYIPPHVNACGFQSRLRSPRLWDPSNTEKKQLSPPPYTPPPMLSPVRSGPGLFWHVLSTSGSVTPKSAPITPRFVSARKSSTETIPEEDSEPPETDIQPHVNIGPQYQAQIPRLNKCKLDALKVKDKADMLWNPSAVDHISDEEVEEYLDFACSSCIPGSGKNKEYALHQLQLVCGNIQEAILKLMQRNCYLPKGHPLVTYQYPETVEWTPDEVDLYNQALSKSEKDFFNIAKEVKTKSVKQCIEFYYVWKKVCPDEYKRLRTIRRKREQDNIFYSLRSKNEDGDSITPKSDSRSATPDKDIICDRFICEYPDCCASFISKQALNGHIRIHGGAASRGISPNRSPAGEHDQHVVVNGIALENESSNQVLDDYPCKICGKVFHKVKSRSAHMKSHRQTDDKKSKVHDVQVGVL